MHHRALAVRDIAAKRQPGTVDLLIAHLVQERTPYVRDLTSEALGNLADPRAIPVLISTLENHSSAKAAWALGKIPDLRALDALLAALSNHLSEVRGQAITALGELHDTRAVPHLKTIALTDTDLSNRIAAATALDKLDPTWSAGVAELHEAVRNLLERLKKQNGARIKSRGYVNNSPRDALFETLSCLRFLLRRQATRFSDEDLRDLKDLGEIYIIEAGYYDSSTGFGADDRKDVFDVEDLRQISREELMQRGRHN
jgi:HEAT repeat protein